mmetsp:Transcript_25610/g.59649  ORF Transcript_25610/g.59649 Transcript_25610/m.59649 type:complete len:241 (-) Transcript_25610:891-1613(-)
MVACTTLYSPLHAPIIRTIAATLFSKSCRSHSMPAVSARRAQSANGAITANTQFLYPRHVSSSTSVKPLFKSVSRLATTMFFRCEAASLKSWSFSLVTIDFKACFASFQFGVLSRFWKTPYDFQMYCPSTKTASSERPLPSLILMPAMPNSEPLATSSLPSHNCASSDVFPTHGGPRIQSAVGCSCSGAAAKKLADLQAESLSSTVSGRGTTEGSRVRCIGHAAVWVVAREGLTQSPIAW